MDPLKYAVNVEEYSKMMKIPDKKLRK